RQLSVAVKATKGGRAVMKPSVAGMRRAGTRVPVAMVKTGAEARVAKFEQLLPAAGAAAPWHGRRLAVPWPRPEPSASASAAGCSQPAVAAAPHSCSACPAGTKRRAPLKVLAVTLVELA
ncbi:hypothetical protein Vafri_13018, partial [Volvox africanus]